MQIFKKIFLSESDEQLIWRMLITAWSYLLVVAIQSQFFPAPYGKFDTKNPISIIDKIRYNPQINHQNWEQID